MTSTERKVYQHRWYEAHKAEQAAYKREWNRTHPEQRKATNRAWKQANKERVKRLNKESLERHKDQRLAYRRDYYQRNKEHENQRNNEWYATHPRTAVQREHSRQVHAAWEASHPKYQIQYARKHPDAARNYAANHRALKKNAPSTLTISQWMAIKVAYRHCCAYCGRKMERLTQDHVIALSKGGHHTPDNVVPACQSCNSRKNANPPPTLPAIRLML